MGRKLGGETSLEFVDTAADALRMALEFLLECGKFLLAMMSTRAAPVAAPPASEGPASGEALGPRGAGTGPGRLPAEAAGPRLGCLPLPQPRP